MSIVYLPTVTYSGKKVAFLIRPHEVEAGAIDQIKAICEYDCVKRMAVMPDAHKGYFIPIGGVVLTEGFISPAGVGYDIGCGVSTLDTQMKAKFLLGSKRLKEKMMKTIIDVVPMGKGIQHDTESSFKRFVSASGDSGLTTRVQSKAGFQLGTLGAGNHFIEVGENKAGNICITIHSGSRNPGHTICDYYTKHGDMLDEKSAIGGAYIQDMKWAIQYSLANRQMMMYNILKALGFNDYKIGNLAVSMINSTHNTAVKTKEGWLHSKGATSAKENELGVIPGNMGDGVVIVRGLGNKKYEQRASHGAGRPFSRNEAKATLSMEEFEESMKGIVSNGITSKNIDESPQAYKDFKKVLDYQIGVVFNLVDVIKPLINIKG